MKLPKNHSGVDEWGGAWGVISAHGLIDLTTNKYNKQKMTKSQNVCAKWRTERENKELLLLTLGLYVKETRIYY